MVTLGEIISGVNNRFKEAIGNTVFENVPILAEDLSDGIVRPSIKVDIKTSKNGKYNAHCREKNLTCRIYFFAKDRYKYRMDNIKMQDFLEDGFLEDLKIGDSFYIPINEVSSSIVDTILICSFEMEMVEKIENPGEENLELMEELELNLKGVIS